jgi:hypothetical protein
VNADEGPEYDEPAPTCTTSEAKRRKACADTAVLSDRVAEAERCLELAESKLEAANNDLRSLRAEAARASKCRRCGASPGRWVCGDADRIVFACTNYVGGDSR